MKLKLDENLGHHCAALLRTAGHDVATVPEEDLCAGADKTVIAACRAEERCLVTLDLDFGNPLLFRPADYNGIAVLRLPTRFTADDLVAALQTLIGGLARSEINRKLWIIQRGRIREYQPDN